MDEKRIAEIKARVEAASPGPWETTGASWVSMVVGPEGEDIAGNVTRRDAEFIANARTDVPDLVAEVEKQREYIAELEGVAHDAAEGVVPAMLLADARIQEREMVLAAASKYTRLALIDVDVFRRQLPPLPVESPTARELRERAASLEKEVAGLRRHVTAVEADNVLLRNALNAIYMPGTKTLTDARNTARGAMEGAE